MPVRRSTHVRVAKPARLAKAPRTAVPAPVDIDRSDLPDLSGSTVGFLHLNRRRLAIMAAAVSFVTLTIHDLPASAVTVKTDVVETVGQTLKVGDTSTPTAGRDEVVVVTYTPVQWPIAPASEVSSGFGYRIAPCSWGCSSDHQGVDFDPGAGTPIAAIADGVVVYAGSESGGLGVHVIVQHQIDGQMVQSVYGHMQYGSMAVSVGQTIGRGQLLGKVGSTGASTGAHLHFEIRPGGGDAVEPLAWLAANATEEFVPAH